MLGPLSPTPKKTDMLAPTPTATHMLSPTDLIVERLEKLESGSRERPALLGIQGGGGDIPRGGAARYMTSALFTPGRRAARAHAAADGEHAPAD